MRLNNHSYWWVGLTVLVAAMGAHEVRADAGARDLMRAVEQWIELKDVLHREKVEWETARASLEQGIDLLTREKELLEARIAEHTTEADAVTDEQVAMEQRRTAQEEALRGAFGVLASWLNTDLERDGALPDKLSEVLNDAIAAQRKHEAIRLDQELLNAPDDTQLLMDVLYLGHAQAYAVSRNDETAAHGVWDGRKWMWKWDARHAPVIREAVRVQQGELAPRWIQLPVTVLSKEPEE